MQPVEALVKSRKREDVSELEILHRRYLYATPPQKNEQQSLAYRLCLLFLDRLPPLVSSDPLSQLERTQRGTV